MWGKHNVEPILFDQRKWGIRQRYYHDCDDCEHSVMEFDWFLFNADGKNLSVGRDTS